MLILFDFRDRRHEFGEEPQFCEHCDRDTAHVLYRSRIWFTLYFVPLFPVSPGSDVAMCNLCGQRSREDGFTEFERPSEIRRPCPDCGELIMPTARHCRFCQYELTKTEIVQGVAERKRLKQAEEKESQIRRLRWKSRMFGVPGWILLLPALMIAVITIVALIDQVKAPMRAAEVFGLICAMVIFALPLVISLLLLNSARNCKRQIAKIERESEPLLTVDDGLPDFEDDRW